MNRKIFTPKQWIIFDYQLGTAIGFADFQSGIPVVVFASDSGETGAMPYEKIENPRKLCVKSGQNAALKHLADSIPNSVISFTHGEA